jgi:hypothetical protein
MSNIPNDQVRYENSAKCTDYQEEDMKYLAVYYIVSPTEVASN